MSSSDLVGIRQTVNRSGIPLLVGAMLFSTGVAVVTGFWMHCRRLSGDNQVDLLCDYLWVVFWTGLAEGVALFIGIWIYRRLARRISTLQTELSDLANGVLHDLKTPITHIHNAAEEALNGQKDAAEALPAIMESCDGLAELIDANSEISRTYGAASETVAVPVDFAAVVRQCAELYADIAAEKSISFTVDLPDVPLPLYVHKAQLQHLAANLVDNAVKFTPRGGRVSVMLARAGRGIARLTVADTGIGIPRAALPRIFRRFYRVDGSRHGAGNGLGLALVQAIVECRNGRIRVESEEGRGSQFILDMPIR